jgi:hypothetical protein
MKYYCLFFCVLGLIGCNQFEIKINDYPVTHIDKTPLLIKQNNLTGISDSMRNEIQCRIDSNIEGRSIFHEPGIEYGGFLPRYPMILLEGAGLQYGLASKGSLKYGEGMMPVSYEIMIKKEDRYLIISSESELKKIFAPVESPAEAISFVCALTHSKPLYVFDLSIRNKYYKKILNKTFVSIQDNDYVVRLYHFERFGCYPHSMYLITYLVTRNGDIKELSREKIYEDMFKTECVD